ncbi:ShlB/FhaC/HecB family hemolysin secretion/activation protein [Halarcobacter bivalviorum]|uniref:Hemolysin secretion/activation protein, ShlB/FhaC/HecB family n=1 Tax=Halarcobacter bivalviorum TaxID=663364 RepID=A0AB33GP01_9BACT|nr:ShlB/FhaC/HecB family hemolysin secretion/activation protein [Halarcobacter bivalviorum]AXH11281.1 hemolysin secretion/activation protein, ShlB/FhaC/HecB family [Halarcobacter bivalviorum]
MRIKNLILIFLFMIFNTNLVFANTPVQQIIKERQSFESQKEQFKKLEKNSNEKIFFNEVKKPLLEKISNEKCVEIKKIEENTITLLSKKEKKKIFQKYNNGCRTLTELNNLTKELTKLYIDKGYVTAKVYFKAQKIEKGILEIIALEGKINNITPKNLYIKNAFLFQEKDYLNLRDLETAIESINRLPSNKATIKIVPAKKIGMSNVEIENKTTNRLNGNIGIDNYGSKKIGKFQGNMNLNFDNPLGINDQFSIYLNSTQNHTKIENSKGNSFVYSFPIGSRLLNTISYKKSSYKQLLKVGITDYETKGYTDTSTFNMKYKLFHNRENRLNLGAFLSRYDTENYIENSQIETSSYSLATKGIELDYLFQQEGFYSYISLTYTKGTDWFGTYNPTDLDENFSFYNIDVSLFKQFLGLQYSFNGHYQDTKDLLFGNNQISIGGPYSVRGYNKEGLSGNSGYYIRNELEKSLSSKLFNIFIQKYFLAYDYGSIGEDESTQGGILASYSLGGKYFYNDFSMQFYYATPLRKKDVEETGKFFGISMGYRF